MYFVSLRLCTQGFWIADNHVTLTCLDSPSQSHFYGEGDPSDVSQGYRGHVTHTDRLHVSYHPAHTDLLFSQEWRVWETVPDTLDLCRGQNRAGGHTLPPPAAGRWQWRDDRTFRDRGLHQSRSPGMYALLILIFTVTLKLLIGCMLLSSITPSNWFSLVWTCKICNRNSLHINIIDGWLMQSCGPLALTRFIPGQGFKIINLQNLSQIWDGIDCNNEHCMSCNVIDASLDTIPKHANSSQ